MEEPEASKPAMPVEPDSVIEAMIFSANDPVDAKKLVAVYEEVTGDGSLKSDEIYAIVARINTRYSESRRPYQIFEWGGGFRIATRPEFAPFIKALHEIDSMRRLSRSLTETLAIIAYKQPVTKPEVDFVRGVDCDYAIRRLLELDLVDVIGRSETVGKPLLYGTTVGFLEKFGLKSVDELPSVREIEDLLDDPAFNRERAELLMSQGLPASFEKESTNPGDAADHDRPEQTGGSGEAATDDPDNTATEHDAVSDVDPANDVINNGSTTQNGSAKR